MVSMNTSAVKVGEDDQKTFDRLQNAQLRVDVAQKTAIIPLIEAMAYTVVGAMSSAKGREAAKSSVPSHPPARRRKPSTSAVQNISVASDAAWQKMQSIPLPGGEGRWALNLEAQKKDSLFGKVLENLVKEGGLFAPVLGLPGIAMSALNSFNNLYGALHAEPVQIIRSNPVRVFATQEAIESTGSSASEIGAVLLQPGTYVLMSAGQAPTDDQLKNLTLAQDRIVRTADAKLTGDDLDAAAADVDVLKNVTYVTFDVQVKRNVAAQPARQRHPDKADSSKTTGSFQSGRMAPSKTDESSRRVFGAAEAPSQKRKLRLAQRLRFAIGGILYPSA